MIVSKRMKDLGIFMSGLTYSPTDLSNKDEGILVLRSSNIQNGKLVYADNVYVNCHLDTNQMVKENDVLICSRNGSARLVGKTAIIPYGLKATWGAFMMLFRPYKKNSNYLNYVFSSQIEKYKGMFSTSTINQLTNSMLGNMFIDYEEDGNVQQRMVTYLDTKLSEIDHQVSLLTSKRDAYLRLKKSIINHAVTRGLNPNVKMKDSGIEWIGEVPEHWEVKRMKDIFFERKELSLTGEEDLLSVSEFYGVARRKDKMNSDEEFESRADSLVGYKICKAHDLVINIMLAWKTGLGISDNDGIVSPAYAVYEGRNIASHFYHYLLRSGMYVKEFKRHSKGIIDSRLRLYNDRFNNISAIYPPLPEQRAIATYLDDKCAKIDTIVSNLNKQISRYGDLKRSLIDEVITGKRAV